MKKKLKADLKNIIPKSSRLSLKKLNLLFLEEYLNNLFEQLLHNREV